MSQLRILGAARLSHETDASTSIERQREQITLTCQRDRHQLVAITEDVDVSGAVSPFDRAELGPWLNGKSDQWDVIMVPKLDRLTRSLRDFDDFRQWCDAHGKTIISIAESLDLSTATGRMFANLLAMFAEFERERMSERRAEASKKLRMAGYHDGGMPSVPWGYKIVKVSDHYELEVDPPVQREAREVVAEILAGKSSRQVAKAHGMAVTTLIGRLRSQTLKGYVMYAGEVVRGDDGMPLTREPVIDEDAWAKVQAALDKNSVSKTNRYDRTPYLGVIFCGCGGKMFLSRWYAKDAKKLREYYSCEKCGKKANGTKLHSDMERIIQTSFEGMFIPETIHHPAEDHTAELAKVEAQIDDLEANFVASGGSVESLGRMLGRLQSKRDALAALPQTEAWVEILPPTRRFLDTWNVSEPQQRGDTLRDMGIKFTLANGMLRMQQAGTEDWPTAPVK